MRRTVSALALSAAVILAAYGAAMAQGGAVEAAAEEEVALA